MLLKVVCGNGFSVTVFDSELNFLPTHLLCRFPVSRALNGTSPHTVTVLSVSLFWTQEVIF